MYRMRTLPLRTLLGGLFYVLVSAPSFVFAQTTDQAYQDTLNKLMIQQQQVLQRATSQQNSVSNYLDVKIDPPLPGPNTRVYISIESYLTDLYKANISWAVDGKVILRGTGKTNFSFQNGPSGKTTTVSLSIITNTGSVVTKDFSFSPVGVTIMWEADTYTPPFYKGRALISPQAGIRIIAVPDNADASNPLGAGNLVYDWKKDGATDTAASGFGKNVYSFVGSKPLTNTKITLAVSTIDDSAQSEMQIYLPQVSPFILFYEKDPLLGVWYNKPLGGTTALTKKEISLSAEPYYFSNERGEAYSLKYVWSVNGSTVSNYGRTITLRNDKGVEGTSFVSLTMRGIVQTFQTATRDLNLTFTGGSNSGKPLF